MKNLKIYLTKWNLEESSLFVDIFQDIDDLKTKYNLSSETGFLYLDVGFARPSDNFLKELYAEYSDKVIISASAKYALEGLIPESTHVVEYKSPIQENTILISFLDLDFKMDEIVKPHNFPVRTYHPQSLGYEFIGSNKLPQEIYEKNIAELDLTVRSTNCLKSIGIFTLGNLLNMTPYDGLRIPNLGRKSWQNIRDDLEEFLERYYLKKKINSTKAILNDDDLSQSIELEENIFSSIKSLAERYSTGEKMSDVFFHRIGINGRPKTLDAVGNELGVTRERIRQIEAKFFKLSSVIRFSSLVDQKITKVRENKLIPIGVIDLEQYDSWFEGIKSKPWLIKSLLKLNKINRNINDDDLLYVNRNSCFMINDDEVVSDIGEKEYSDILSKMTSSSIGMSDDKDIEVMIQTNLPNAPELFTTARESIKTHSSKGKHGTGKAVLDIIFSNSKKPLSKEKIYELAKAPELKFKGTQRTLENILAGLKVDYSPYCLFSGGKFGLFDHFNFTDADIKIIEEFIQKETDKAESKQFNCLAVLKLLKKSSEFEGMECKNRLDQYGIKAIVQRSDKYYVNRFMFSLKGERTRLVSQSYLVIEALENSEIPLSSNEIKDYISRRTNISGNFQIHSRKRLVPLIDEKIKKQYWSRGKRNGFRYQANTKWMLLDRHCNLDVNKMMTIINKVKAILSKPAIRESNEYKRGLNFQEITELIRDDDDLNPYVGNINLLYSICERSAYIIARDKKGTRNEKDGLFLTEDFISNNDTPSTMEALKKIVINITKAGMTKKNIEIEIQKIIGKKPSMGTTISYLSDMEFKFDEHDQLWFKGDCIEI